ncbi:MAG: hypothetical protein ACRCSF_06055 [Mycobacteriaceae bacterium]
MKISISLLILSTLPALAAMFYSAGSSSLPTNVVLSLYALGSAFFLGLAGLQLRREKKAGNLSSTVLALAAMGFVVSAILYFFHRPDSIGEGILILGYSASTIITVFVCVLLLFSMGGGSRSKG